MGYVWISACSVFEGLQIIYSPFRRRELFSFDRFIRRRSVGRSVGLRYCAARNIDVPISPRPSRFFFVPSTSARSQPRPWLSAGL